MPDLFFEFLAGLALACGILSLFVAVKDHLGFYAGWFIIGFCLGPIGLVLVTTAGRKKRDKGYDFEEETQR